jgi:hypothetical protein
MCAAAGFDFAFIDGEHGGAEDQELEHHVRAGESFGMPSVVRIGSHQPSEILRALDIWCRRHHRSAREHEGGSGGHSATPHIIRPSDGPVLPRRHARDVTPFPI